MADVITRLKVESSEYDSKIKRAANELNRMTHEAEVNGTKIATANKENIALAQSLGKMATVSTTARGKMSELSAAIESATIQYNRLSAAEKQGQFGKALNASIGQLQTRLAGLKTEMAAVQTQMGKTNAMSSGMGGFGAGIKGGLAMMGPQAMGFAAVAGAAMGVKKVFSDLIGINKEFEQSHANLAAVMGKTRGETEALATQAKQLGATTQYTAMQILDLQTNLARLGFSEREILNSTKAVQALATATNADLGEAANLAGAALRGFGLDAKEMDRVASVLAVSTSKSALSFDKLATAIPIVAPVAKQFGFSIEDTVTMIGKLSDAGMDASMAATATRNIFLKMADGSGKLSQAMGRPVHSVEEFGEALKEMKEKGMSLNDILKMVGVRSTAAFAVFADNADTLGKFKGEITDCGDQLDKMVAEQLNTLEGSLKILNSAWEGLMLTFSESNGVIKTVVDGLAELLQAWTKWRNRNAGGDAAIQTYEVSEDNIKSQANTKLGLLRGDISSSKGNKWFSGEKMSDDAILKQVNDENAKLNKQIETLKKLEQEYQQYKSDLKTAQNSGDTEKAVSLMKKNPLKGTDYIGKSNVVDNIYKDIASAMDKVRVNEYIASALTPATTTTTNQNKGKGLGGSDLNAKKKAEIEAAAKAEIAALDKVQMIKEGKEEEYEDRVYAIRKSALEQIAQLYAEDTKEYAQVQAQKSQLDIQYQNTKLRLLKKTEAEQKKADKADDKAAADALRKQKQIDNSILSGLTGKAKQVKWSTSDLGLDGLKTKIDTGVDISDDEWTKFQDKLNERLKSLGLDPIQINFETGNIEEVFDEAKVQQEKFMSDLGKGVGSASNIVGAMDSLKGVGDDLASVFSGDMDAWDSLMTVMQSGLSILQTVISLTETMNTLKELSIAISGAKKTAEITEATTTMAAAGTEVAAETEKTAASGMATAANTAEAASGAGKAMASIPIVGPILAIAAIAAVLAAILAATSKSKSAGKFASGGIIPGNSFSGDNLTANVNSGELILSRAQSDSIASQLQGGATQTVVVEGRISGKDILLSANNTNRAAGGSRGYYTKVH